MGTIQQVVKILNINKTLKFCSFMKGNKDIYIENLIKLINSLEISILETEPAIHSQFISRTVIGSYRVNKIKRVPHATFVKEKELNITDSENLGYFLREELVLDYTRLAKEGSLDYDRYNYLNIKNKVNKRLECIKKIKLHIKSFKNPLLEIYKSRNQEVDEYVNFLNNTDKTIRMYEQFLLNLIKLIEPNLTKSTFTKTNINDFECWLAEAENWVDLFTITFGRMKGAIEQLKTDENLLFTTFENLFSNENEINNIYFNLLLHLKLDHTESQIIESEDDLSLCNILDIKKKSQQFKHELKNKLTENEIHNSLTNYEVEELLQLLIAYDITGLRNDFILFNEIEILNLQKIYIKNSNLKSWLEFNLLADKSESNPKTVTVAYKLSQLIENIKFSEQFKANLNTGIESCLKDVNKTTFQNNNHFFLQKVNPDNIIYFIQYLINWENQKSKQSKKYFLEKITMIFYKILFSDIFEYLQYLQQVHYRALIASETSPTSSGETNLQTEYDLFVRSYLYIMKDMPVFKNVFTEHSLIAFAQNLSTKDISCEDGKEHNLLFFLLLASYYHGNQTPISTLYDNSGFQIAKQLSHELYKYLEHYITCILKSAYNNHKEVHQRYHIDQIRLYNTYHHSTLQNYPSMGPPVVLHDPTLGQKFLENAQSLSASQQPSSLVAQPDAEISKSGQQLGLNNTILPTSNKDKYLSIKEKKVKGIIKNKQNINYDFISFGTAVDSCTGNGTVLVESAPTPPISKIVLNCKSTALQSNFFASLKGHMAPLNSDTKLIIKKTESDLYSHFPSPPKTPKTFQYNQIDYDSWVVDNTFPSPPPNPIGYQSQIEGFDLDSKLVYLQLPEVPVSNNLQLASIMMGEENTYITLIFNKVQNFIFIYELDRDNSLKIQSLYSDYFHIINYYQTFLLQFNNQIIIFIGSAITGLLYVIEFMFLLGLISFISNKVYLLANKFYTKLPNKMQLIVNPYLKVLYSSFQIYTELILTLVLIKSIIHGDVWLFLRIFFLFIIKYRTYLKKINLYVDEFTQLNKGINFNNNIYTCINVKESCYVFNIGVN